MAKNKNNKNNKNNSKYIILAVIVVIIVLAILFLQKNGPSSSQQINNFIPNAEKEQQYSRAVEVAGGTGYINSNSSLSLSSFVGNKVVLIDFWTYSCINCIRTIPYLSSWYEKYHDQGLEIIGVHTPEFSFEKDYSNVANAVKKLGIQYPVVLDSNYSIWNAYHNQYWPAEYLIDGDGYVVESHFGEGDYNTTEKTIQKLLQERANKLNLTLNMPPSTAPPANNIPIEFDSVKSPETYFGATRNNYLATGVQGKVGVQNFSLPDGKLKYNQLYLVGSWNITAEYASPLDSNSSLLYGYSAKNVYVVASSIQNRTIIGIVDSKYAALIKIGPYNLYPLVLGDSYGTHAIELHNLSRDMQFYTFTFG